jgi:protein-disulfide isomerase
LAVGTALAVGAMAAMALAWASARSALRQGAEIVVAADRLAADLRSGASAAFEGEEVADASLPTPTPTPRPRSRLWRKVGSTRIFGPADASFQIVVFSDFQCADCARVEAQLERVLARGDTAVAVRHFPLSSACNPGIPRDLHPDACRRARLAEAAGLLGGDDAYLAAHRALFALHAASGPDPADAIARATGLPRERLVEASALPEIEAIVAGDIADAVALGVTTTPMVFVNGREWRFALTGGSLDELVARLAREGAASRGVAEPPDAAGKLVDDWRLTPRLVDDALARIAEGGLLLRDAAVAGSPEVRVWLDYRLPGAQAVDAALAEVAAAGVSFTLRVHLYPVSSSCNPRSGVQGGDAMACLVAAALLAAASVGGDEGARAMHAALIERGPTIDGAGLVALAVELGLDRDAFASLLAGGDALVEARRDADRLNDAMRPTVLPLVLIDGRPVPRWSHPGCSAAEVFRRAIERAAAERGS